MGLIESMQTALLTLPQVQLAVLFGSFAKGSADVRSDVDVAVLVAPNTVLNRIEVETTLGRVAQRGVDLIDLTLAMPLLRFEVARDGILLCERQAHLWADVRARAMIDWWDWGYTATRAQALAIGRLRKQLAG